MSIGDQRAFPLGFNDGISSINGMAGMTLHQYYVGQAVNGLCAAIKKYPQGIEKYQSEIDEFTKVALNIADSAVRHLDKREEDSTPSEDPVAELELLRKVAEAADPVFGMAVKHIQGAHYEPKIDSLRDALNALDEHMGRT